MPGCRCKCLEEDEDEREGQLLLEDETARRVNWESIALYRVSRLNIISLALCPFHSFFFQTKHIENKYKTKKKSMEKVEQKIRKKMNLSEKFDIVFSKPSYDFEPAEVGYSFSLIPSWFRSTKKRLRP